MTCLQKAESTTTDRALRAELSAWKSRRLPFRTVRAVLLWAEVPAFPFGFGLSYTEFEYSDIHAENKDGSIEVSLKIKNIGSFDGKTVVQVYAGANGDHPVKLLKGFKKVNVPAGKEIEETVTVYKDDLKFYDEKTGEWYLENEYIFYVGQDSVDAMNNRLTVSV